MALTSGGLVKASVNWTPEQYAWLQAQAKRLGIRSVSAAAKLTVQAAMNAAQAKEPAE